MRVPQPRRVGKWLQVGEHLVERRIHRLPEALERLWHFALGRPRRRQAWNALGQWHLRVAWRSALAGRDIQLLVQPEEFLHLRQVLRRTQARRVLRRCKARAGRRTRARRLGAKCAGRRWAAAGVRGAVLDLGRVDVAAHAASSAVHFVEAPKPVDTALSTSVHATCSPTHIKCPLAPFDKLLVVADADQPLGVERTLPLSLFHHSTRDSKQPCVALVGRPLGPPEIGLTRWKELQLRWGLFICALHAQCRIPRG